MPDKPKVDDPNEGNDDVKNLLAGFKEMTDEVKEAVVASRATPPPAPAPKADDSFKIAERKAAAQAKYEASRDKVNEQLAAGDGAGAMESFMESVIGIQNANAPDPENSPQVKAGIASAKKLSRAENKEMFDEYGAEIEADMAALPAEERINPEAWDDAVDRAKASHIDDIIAARETRNAEDVKKAEDDARAAATGPPMATRGRASHTPSEGINADNLTTEQLEAAQSCGLTPEKYAEATENYDKHTQKGGSVLFLNESTKDLKIKPGAF